MSISSSLKEQVKSFFKNVESFYQDSNVEDTATHLMKIESLEKAWYIYRHFSKSQNFLL